MVINSQYLTDKKKLAIPGQTTTGKEFLNSFMAGSLPKTINSDFLSSCSINYVLTVSPTIYASYIEQFWNTASSKTINSVKQIHAIVDGQAVVILESSMRSDLLFDDDDGITCLTNDEIFENLALMGYEQLSTKLTFPKGGDSVERAITTDASLVAAQDSYNIIKTQTTAMPNVDIPHGMDIGGSPRRQETMGGTPAQTRSERVLEQPNEPPPLNVTHLEGRMIGEIDKHENVNLVSDHEEVHKTAETLKYDDDATLAETLLNIKRSITKDKGKRITQETKLRKKIKKREMIQLSIDEELAQKLHAEELAKETARQERKNKGDQTQDIDWNDPEVLRYHALQNRVFSKAEFKLRFCWSYRSSSCCLCYRVFLLEDLKAVLAEPMTTQAIPTQSPLTYPEWPNQSPNPTSSSFTQDDTYISLTQQEPSTSVPTQPMPTFSQPTFTQPANPQNSNQVQTQQFQQFQTATISANNAKFSYLEKEKYKIWTMKMEYWIQNTNHNVWRIIQEGNSPKRLGKDSKGNTIVHPPVSYEEHVAVQRENKVRTLLLQVLPEYHMPDFHHYDDARDIWMAVKARFGGNEESKKMRKTMLKQQFTEFSARPDNDDINIKFLRALPSSWSQVALALKTRGGLESMSFDDLYNKLRSLELDVRIGHNYGVKAAAPIYSAFVGASSSGSKPSYSDQQSIAPIVSQTSGRSNNIMECVLHSFVAENDPD
nr:xylulose kinase-1 [Tanacetum cinerariifolium]